MPAGFGANAPTSAAYPIYGVYPAVNFRGAGARAGVGPSGGSAVAAVTGTMPAGVRSNSTLVLVIAVVVAAVLWHWTSGR